MKFIQPNIVYCPGLSVSQNDSPADEFGLSLIELEKATRMTSWNIRQTLKKLGWNKPRGGRGGGAWSKPTAPPFTPESDTPTGDRIPEHTERPTRKLRKTTVVLDSPGQQGDAATVH